MRGGESAEISVWYRGGWSLTQEQSGSYVADALTNLIQGAAA